MTIVNRTHPGVDTSASDHGRLPRPSILLVTGSLQAGGAERVLSDMANYWVAKNWKVTLATWSQPDIPDFYSLNSAVDRMWLDDPVSQKPRASQWGKNLARIRRLRRILANQTPDAVLSFIDSSNVLTILAALGLQTRVFVSERIHPEHHRSLPRKWRFLRALLYRRANGVIAQTKDAAKWIEKNCMTEARVIPNPLRKMPRLAEARKSQILSVGRLSRQKGFDILIRAFGQIFAEFRDWHLMIVGSGPEEQSLMNLLDELCLTSRVKIVPQQKNVESLMAQAASSFSRPDSRAFRMFCLKR